MKHYTWVVTEKFMCNIFLFFNGTYIMSEIHFILHFCYKGTEAKTKRKHLNMFIKCVVIKKDTIFKTKFHK
jgi:hypothetical protein